MVTDLRQLTQQTRLTCRGGKNTVVTNNIAGLHHTSTLRQQNGILPSPVFIIYTVCFLLDILGIVVEGVGVSFIVICEFCELYDVL